MRNDCILQKSYDYILESSPNKNGDFSKLYGANIRQ